MEEWLDNGSILGDYWVYDTNGWAYWASPVVPETATGLLLDEVDIVREPLDDWYYAINVVSEIGTQDDIGSKEDGTGFYEDATVRTWVNTTFYNTLTSTLQAKIVPTDLSVQIGAYNSETHKTLEGELVFLPSKEELGWAWDVPITSTTTTTIY